MLCGLSVRWRQSKIKIKSFKGAKIMAKRQLSWLLAGVAVALASGAALAAMDSAKIAAAKKAGDDFLAITKGSETTGRIPRQNDPKVKILLDRVFDRTAFGKAVLPLSESGKIGELLNNANRIGFAYMLAGSGLTELGKLDEDPKAMEAPFGRRLHGPTG